MSKIWKVMRDTILVLLVIGVSFGGGYAFCKYYKTESVAIEDENTGIDLKLPGEVEKRIVTVEEVESKLVMSVIPYRKLPSIKAKIQEIDPSAFVIVSKVEEVGGQGFTTERIPL